MTKILIIEDSPKNQAAAKMQMPDATVVNYDEAFNLFRDAHPESYDAVLTDLFFMVERNRVIHPSPFSSSYPGNIAMIGTEQSFGLAFALKAVELGIPSAIVTDTNHHSSVFTGLLDMFAIFFPLEGDSGWRVSTGGGNLKKIDGLRPLVVVLHDLKCPFAEDMHYDGSKIVMKASADHTQRVKDWRQVLKIVSQAIKR